MKSRYKLSDLFRYGQNESQDDVNITVMKIIKVLNEARLSLLAVKVCLTLLNGIIEEMEAQDTDG